MKRNPWIVLFVLLIGLAPAAIASETEPKADTAPATESEADEPKAEATTKDGPKVVSGMSILGNQEAPKSLVIVPWKTSVLGDSLGIATMLDDSKQPVDREVFLRALSYYEIRSEKRP